ncbi:MAG TPA: transposase [Candidatus Sumerlaeota bacterium]|nr:transposase [Candidatus Sumerlaeota bacterium]
MARIARIAIPRYPYLVTQFGRDEGAIFFEPEERKLYCEYLRHYAEEFGLDVWAYCLLENQVILLVYPRRNSSLALAIGRAHMRFAAEVNRRHGWSGHFWADRFHSTLLDKKYVLEAARFVETAPVRAGLAKRAPSYPWSSAKAHASGKEDSLLAPNRPILEAPEIGKWATWLGETPDEKMQLALSRNVKTGRPCGSLALLQKLEERLGLSLTPRKRGPKPKQPAPPSPRARAK